MEQTISIDTLSKIIKPIGFYIALVFIVTFSYCATAKELVIDDNTNNLAIAEFLDYYVDDGGRQTLKEVLSTNNSVQFNAVTDPNFGYTHSSYWFRLTIANKSSSTQNWYLVQNFTNMHYLDLYVPNKDSTEYKVKFGGNLRHATERDIYNRHTVFIIPIETGERKTFYLKAYGGASKHLHLALWKPKEFTHFAFKDAVFYGGFQGVLLVMFFYNIIIFWYLRDHAYKWLSIYIGSVIIGSSVYQGLTQLILSKSTLAYSIYAIPSIVPIISISLILFTQQFLKPSNPDSIKSLRISKWLVRVNLLGYLFVSDYVLAMKIMGPVFIASLIYCIYLLSQAYKSKVYSVKWYALSWLAMIFSASFASLSNFGFIPANNFTSNSYLIGITWMILLMSIALADRVYKLRVTAEKSQLALNESESQRLMVMKAGKLGTWLWEKKTNKVTWSEECRSLFGIKEEDFEGTTNQIINLVVEEDRSYLNINVTSALENKRPFYVEFRIARPDGARSWVSAYGKTVLDRNLNAIGLEGTLQDITEFKQTKEGLRDSELNYRRLFQSAADGFIILSENGDVTDCNPAACAMYGYNKEEFLKLNIKQIIQPQSTRLMGALSKVISSGEPFSSSEVISVRKNNTQLPAQLQANAMLYHSIPHIFLLIRDISRQKKVQDTLKFLATSIAYKSNIEFYQELVLKLTDTFQSKVAFVGKLNSNNNDSPLEIKCLAFCVSGQLRDSFHYPYQNSVWEKNNNGSVVVLTEKAANNFPNDLLISSFSGESVIYESLTDSRGKKLGVVMVIDDRIRTDFADLSHLMPLFSTRVTAEIERSDAEEALKKINVQLEDMVSTRTSELTLLNKELESFSYSVSHDLRSPLRAINGYSQLLKEELNENLSAKEISFLDKIISSTRHMSNLIDDLLALSRVSRKDFETKKFNISNLVQSCIDQFSEADPRKNLEIVVERDLMSDGDPDLMSIAIENLVSNAWKYTSKNSHTKIEFGALMKSSSTTYYIKDNGIGFDMKYSDKLFKAFHRLHKADDYEGTGIGLATVSRIIDRHKGKIWAKSKIGKGTTFYFQLNCDKFEQNKSAKSRTSASKGNTLDKINA